MAAVKFPSARQPVFFNDKQTGEPVFTRPWFLFLQSVWERQGGAVAPSTEDISGSLFEDAGTGEIQATLYQSMQDSGQAPIVQGLLMQQAELQTELQAQRDMIAELWKALQDIKQSPIL